MSKLEELENSLKDPAQINIMQRIDNVLFSHGGLTTEFVKWLDEDLLDAEIDDVISAVNDASQDYLMFRSGDDYDLEYDFDNAEYPKLLEKYGVDKTAGDGTEFEKALALMDAYAERLHHASDYDNHIDMNAISLLEFSLD